jgi:hypothetical protein
LKIEKRLGIGFEQIMTETTFEDKVNEKVKNIDVEK